jgi:hypothetical protein
VGAFGGIKLVAACGCCEKTFFNHVNLLVAIGFLVVLKRGGRVGSRNVGNVYGVPGAEGGLSHMSVKRMSHRMVVRLDGQWEPQVTQPGDIPGLWHKSIMEQSTNGACKNNKPVDKPACKNNRRGLYNPHTTIPSPSPNGKNHGVLRRDSQKKWAPLLNLTTVDLTEISTLVRLYDQCVDNGDMTGNEHNRIMFVGAACKAVRIADNPPALFVSTLHHGRLSFVAECDQDAAVAMLKRLDHGVDRRKDPDAWMEAIHG